jgi:eukaryotic-like serine/threonine-protein kinase
LASGLLTPQDLDEARGSVRWSGGDEPDTNAPPNDPQLADRLVDMGKLNSWQAKQLLEGRTKFNLGPYWIIDSIGQGGMGQVFKAEHSILGRVVAIKVLPLSKSTPEAVVSFTNEIRAMARLEHQRLVRATDAGHDGNVHYLVTEYVPGTDLRKLVRRIGPLSMEKAAGIIYQVAEGLHYAHGQGLIHRDVKPGNVLVTPEGQAKLSDLGLSGPLDSDAEKDPRFGKVVGTADYIAPDQIAAPWQPAPAWDIYSLGCTLYYAVTGKVPFPGGTTGDKARAHRELRPLHPRRLNANLSTEFVDLIADMMAKDPAQRIPSAADVMVRLTPWLRKPEPPPLPAARPLPAKPQPLPTAVSSGARWASAPAAVKTSVTAADPSAPAAGMADTAGDFSQLPQASSDSDDSSSLVLQMPDASVLTKRAWHTLRKLVAFDGEQPNWKELLLLLGTLVLLAASAVAGLVWLVQRVG